MPLRALLSGRDVVAPLLDDADWASLRADVKAKRLVLDLPCCDASAFPRVSKLGTRHFVHRRGAGCPGSGETFQHLWLKAEILAACEQAGWPAKPEVAAEGWRADVLASRERKRIAFEVQWSRQDDPTIRFRQERYAADGIRACWLYRGDPPAPPSRELPVFRLVPDDEQVAVVALGGGSYGVREFVGLLLGGHVRFSETQTVRLRVSFIEMDCWRCHRTAHIFFARQHSRCGWEPDSLRYGDVDEFDPALLALVRE
jgi:competence protein CoiA